MKINDAQLAALRLAEAMSLTVHDLAKLSGQSHWRARRTIDRLLARGIVIRYDWTYDGNWKEVPVYELAEGWGIIEQPPRVWYTVEKMEDDSE